jgi:hypothetical protein
VNGGQTRPSRFRDRREVFILKAGPEPIIQSVNRPVPTRDVVREADVPLSEHEQRLLEQMERALYEDDPKLASTLRGSDMRRRARRRFGLAAIGFLIGVALLLAGVVSQVWPVSVLGFVQMLVSVTYVVSWWGKAPTADPTAEGATGPRPARKASKGRSSGSFMDNVEERWRRRRDENGL